MRSSCDSRAEIEPYALRRRRPRTPAMTSAAGAKRPTLRGCSKCSMTSGLYGVSLMTSQRELDSFAGENARSRVTSRFTAAIAISTSLRRREAAEAEAQRALRQLVAATQRPQHVRRFFRRRRTRGPGRDRQLAQRELQALAFDAVKAHVEHVRRRDRSGCPFSSTSPSSRCPAHSGRAARRCARRPAAARARAISNATPMPTI